MDYGFDRLISEAASYRAVLPGTIIGSGSISEGAPERVGSSNIVEVVGYEVIHNGEATTKFATWGEHLKLDIVDGENKSVFGTIEQTLVKA
jgi:fumarylacetoacetate (FAA) hydrolase